MRALASSSAPLAGPPPGASARRPGAWRAFADAIALALGINLWLALVVFPAAFVGAMSRGPHLAISLIPVVALGVGVWRRSEAILLFAFPSALLLPVAVNPEMVAAHVYGPIHFALVAAALVTYLFGASVFTSFHDPPAPVSIRPLSSSMEEAAPRWRRRARVYAYLVVISALIPGVLLYAINFDDAVREFIERMYPARAASFTAVLNLGLLGFWLLVYGRVFLDLMATHRTGDRAHHTTLAIIRAQAQTRKPRLLFYLALAVAAFGIGTLFLLY